MPKVTVVLVEPNNSGNVGAVARAMANFGVSNLVLVNPNCKIDVEARNRAKHAQKILDDAKTKTFKQALKISNINIATTGVPCSDYNVIRSPALIVDALKQAKQQKGNISIFFGREDKGLLNEEIHACDFTLTIPASKKYPILNLSHAVAVVLYELSKPLNEKDQKETHKQATQREKEEVRKELEKAVDRIGFPSEAQTKTQKLVWNRIIGKSMLTSREANAILGFIKKLK